jgi:hypothetical protein
MYQVIKYKNSSCQNDYNVKPENIAFSSELADFLMYGSIGSLWGKQN